MGYWKNKAMEQEADYDWARDFLCEVGALEECENHPGAYYSGSSDVEDAYKALNARVTSGQIVLENDQSRRERTNLIKAVYDDNSGLSRCPICERNLGPD